MKTYTVCMAGGEYTFDVDASGRWSMEGTPVESPVQETGPGVYAVNLGGRTCRVVARSADEAYLFLLEGVQRVATVETERTRLIKRYARPEGTVHHRLEIHAPMPALVGRLLVAAGDEVQAGQPLLVLEAMKMENEIKAHRDARVKEIVVVPGHTVEKGQLLIVLE
jgi:biotin carboxyl carrier protein